MGAFLRPALYAAACIGGIKLMDTFNAVGAGDVGNDDSVGAALSSLRSSVSSGSSLKDALGGSASSLLGGVKSKIKTNVVLGCVIGGVVAGTIDYFFLE